MNDSRYLLQGSATVKTNRVDQNHEHEGLPPFSDDYWIS
jgi:hypothetical protein